MLAKAARLFRERGYAATSMRALSDAMGMGEQSIYNAFGSKAEVFAKALDHYCAASRGIIAPLYEPTAGLAEIRALFGMIAATLGGAAPSCMVAQTCLNGPHHEAVRRLIHGQLQSIEAAFLNATKNAMASGEISGDDPEKIARFLNMTLQGLAVLAGSGASSESMSEVADVALDGLT